MTIAEYINAGVHHLAFPTIDLEVINDFKHIRNSNRQESTGHTTHHGETLGNLPSCADAWHRLCACQWRYNCTNHRRNDHNINDSSKADHNVWAGDLHGPRHNHCDSDNHPQIHCNNGDDDDYSPNWNNGNDHNNTHDWNNGDDDYNSPNWNDWNDDHCTHDWNDRDNRYHSPHRNHGDDDNDIDDTWQGDMRRGLFQ
jgi:hypothetical protein